MGKLNSLIKFVVFNANALLFLGGIGMIVVASLVLTADFIKLAQTYMQTRGIVLVVIGVFVAAMSVIGCVGTHRQIQRDRLWSGRRILSLYQVILVSVVVGQGLVQMKLYSIEVSLTEAAADLPDEHGEFEGRFRDGFNEAYYEQLCSTSAGGESWVWSLAEDLCPGAISRDECSCTDVLDGSGLPLLCSVAETYSEEECCPDHELCEDGLEEACPYAACRSGILDGLLNYITPARKYSTFVFVMEGLVLILTCLLICYNPRDSTEDILIKTGTLVKRRGQPEGGGGAGGEGGGVGGGSTPFDVGGASGAKHPASTEASDAFKLALVQPAAAGAARRSAAALREGTGRHQPRGSGTPLMSSLAAGNAPKQPLQQFMTPRLSGDKVVFTPDSPTEGDDGAFEYYNPRQGKSASVGPQRSSAASAADKAMAAAAIAAPVVAAGSAELSRGGTKATAAGAVAAATASQRHKREEKTGQDDDGLGGEEKKEIPSLRQAQYDEGEGEEEDTQSFYDELGAQTPVAAYGNHGFGAGEEEPAVQRPEAAVRETSSLDPRAFLTEDSMTPDAPTSTGSLHASGIGSRHALPSPISPLLADASPGDNGTDAAGKKPSRLDEQAQIRTSPMATNNPPPLHIATLAANTTVAAGRQEKGAEMLSTCMPPRTPRMSAQTPISSPTGASPPTFAGHTVAPLVAPAGGDAEEKCGTPTDSGTTPPAAVDEPVSAREETPPQSDVSQAPPNNLSVSAENDTQRRQEIIGAPSGDGPRPGKPDFVRRFLAQTPVWAQTSVGARAPLGVQTPAGVAVVGFNTPTMSPAVEQHQQDPALGSAAYPGNRGSSFSSVVAAEALRLGPPSEGSSEPVDPVPTPQHVVSTVGGDSRKFSVQTPVASPRGTQGLNESRAFTDTPPATSIAQEAGAAAGAGATVETILPPEPSQAEPEPKAEEALSAAEGGRQSFMAQTPVPRGNPGLYESTASADTQPTTSPVKEATASAAAAAGVTGESILPQEPSQVEPSPRAEQVMSAAEGGRQSFMAQTPVPQGNPRLYESTLSADTQPTTSPVKGEGEGGGEGGGCPAGTNDAAPSEPTASKPLSRFARFLLQAEESKSRAQMTLSLEPEPAAASPAAASPDTPPAHISPLRPDSAAAAGTSAAAERSADKTEDKHRNSSEETPVQGESAAGGGHTVAAGGEQSSGEAGPGDE